ncbi:unnamed protein product, partial [Ectocarpus sp. 12 AP-2014]
MGGNVRQRVPEKKSWSLTQKERWSPNRVWVLQRVHSYRLELMTSHLQTAWRRKQFLG